MRLRHLAFALLLLPLAVDAGDIKTVVRKDSILVSPVDPQGLVTVSGPPGCVLGIFPIQIMAMNKKTDVAVAGAVAPDGSFAIRIPAAPKHKIKLTFTGANGKDKKVSVKVPKTILFVPAALPAEVQIQHSTVTVPQGYTSAPAPPLSAPVVQQPIPPPPPMGERILLEEQGLSASGVIE